MVVHEWGTFTSLQDESGQAISGLNTDDEPVPDFVHTTLDMLVSPTQLPPSFLGKAPGSVGFFGKGIPGLHLDVTMRLETPVMYFYPPEGTALDLEELGVPLPATFAAYLDLGRLRNALILNEQEVRPTSHLWDFINTHRLSGYQPPATAENQETVVREEWDQTLPARFALEQNYPNPFNSETSLRFALPQPTTVELAVYNLAGQQVAQLVYGPRPAGLYAMHWDGRSDAGRSLATGVYLYRLQTEGQTLTRKLLLLR